jgi:hypothetical protein
MRRLAKILIASVIVISLAVAFVLWMVRTSIDEFYSPSYTSYSVAMARENGVLISQPYLENSEIKLGDFKYAIQEVWIEQATSIKYQWGFFRKSIPSGYRLMVNINVPSDSPAERSMIGSPAALERQVVCNGSIEVGTVVPSITPNTWLYYGQIQQPFPSSVRCTFEKIQ